MKLFDILKLKMPALNPVDCKIHLAIYNGRDDPINLFLAGNFPAWQRTQGKRVFQRRYIVSLIKKDEQSKWLFAGVHSSHGCKAVKIQLDHAWSERTEYFVTRGCHIIKPAFYYHTKELPEFDALTGRLIIEFSRPGRQPYLRAENWTEGLEVNELKPRRFEIEEFPGFRKVLLLKPRLDTIVKKEIEGWKSALKSVAGVYLVTDTKTRRHYVGSAYGIGGIWSRWKKYSESGHGGDKILKDILQKEGLAYSSNFQFSILEMADTHSSKDDVLKREKHWKDALCSYERYGGLNA